MLSLRKLPSILMALTFIAVLAPGMADAGPRRNFSSVEVTRPVSESSDSMFFVRKTRIDAAAAPYCVGWHASCQRDKDCCFDLVCSNSGICVFPTN